MSRLIEIHHKGSTSQFGDSDLPLTIGSTTNAHIFLPEAMEVEGYIGDSKGHLFLQPAENSSPIYHNGQHVDASKWIKSADTTRIGSVLLHYIISGDLVEIHVAEVDDKEVLIPPDSPHPDIEGGNEPLPRASKDINAARRRKKMSLLVSRFFSASSPGNFLCAYGAVFGGCHQSGARYPLHLRLPAGHQIRDAFSWPDR